MTLISILIVLISRLRCSWIELFRGPVGILVYGILVFGVVRYTHESARYHFLFYPIVLATLAAASMQLAGLGRGFLVFAAVFLLSGDFSPSHIAAVDKPSVAFRTGPFAQKARLWFPRADFESAADYLRNVVKKAPDDLFVVRACPPIARLFQARRYASFYRRSSLRFYELSRERGTRDLWEGRLLLSSFEELREASRSDQTVWLVQPSWRANQFQPEAIWGGRLERVTQELLSRDGGIQVLRVSLKRQ